MAIFNDKLFKCSQYFPKFEIKSLFGMSIHTLHIDNAKEILISLILELFTKPIVLTLCKRMGLPNLGIVSWSDTNFVIWHWSLLGGVVFIACIWLGMLCKVPDGHIPYFVLNPKHDMFPFLLKIFDCVCFVLDLVPIRPYWILKFLNVYFKCVKGQKGNRCFCSIFNRFVISVDVTFFKPSLIVLQEYHRQNQKIILCSF